MPILRDMPLLRIKTPILLVAARFADDRVRWQRWLTPTAVGVSLGILSPSLNRFRLQQPRLAP